MPALMAVCIFVGEKFLKGKISKVRKLNGQPGGIMVSIGLIRHTEMEFAKFCGSCTIEATVLFCLRVLAG